MKSEPGARERHPGSRAPPEPEGPPPGRPREDRPEIPRRRDSGGDGHSHKKKKKKNKKKKRGGAKHQKHCREQRDPFRRSHRPLGAATLALARSFRAGLERRI